jgi:iron complex transport system substrate-binding protein
MHSSTHRGRPRSRPALRWARPFLGLAVAAGMLVGAAPAGAAPAPSAPELPVTVANADGSSTTVTDVSRIIPLNGDLAEVVFALGLGANVVATDVSATYPAEAAALPKVGYQRTLSAEGILSFRPTVVIGNTDAGPPPVIAQLRAAGVPVVILDVEPSLRAPAQKIELVAEALGVPQRGADLAKETTASIKAATKLAKQAKKDKPRAMFLYLRGASTQMIGGQGTGVDVMVRAANATDAAAGLTGFVPVTAEAIVAGAPDVLIVTTSGLQSVGGIDGLLKIPGLAQTPAGATRTVLAYDDQLFLGGGPRTGAALEQFVLDLHPALAKKARAKR